MSDSAKNAAGEGFVIERLAPADAGDVARLHLRCFPDYFLTQLGRGFVRRYYAEFCRHPFDYGVAARRRDTGELAGFAVGTADAQAHFRSFYRRNALRSAPLVAWRAVTNPIVRRLIWNRLAHIRAALRALLPGGRRPASQTLSDKGPKDQCPVRLLSSAVAPEHRGSGVAAQVTASFEAQLRAAGHKRVGLSVFTNNERAIGFFKKSGWVVTYSSDAGVWFERDLQ
jgi:ribosomal protein S18 acetylase RimI-like enzyme